MSVEVPAPNRFVIRRSAAEKPQAGEVRVELDSAGICGGDLSHLRGRNAVGSYPTILGHECAGRIAAVGADVHLLIGQPVVIYPTSGCGTCRACSEGRFNNCPTMRVRGLSDPRGLFSESFIVSASDCVLISESVLHRYGALVEPLAVGVHIAGRSGARTGDTALVIGCGSIGLATALVAVSRGVRVLGADRHGERSTAAHACGVKAFTTVGDAALVQWVGDQADSVDIVYDTVCSPSTIDVAQRVLAPGGRLVAIASAKPGQQATLDYSALYARELSVVACRNYVRDDFVDAAALLESGRVDATGLHTATFALDDFGSAVDQLESHGHHHIKILLTPRRLLDSRPLLAACPGLADKVR
ncbi:oxidoreductase [Mycobacterium aquaticum]|uniref:Oxidoreductase n=1 Tax=Mycobacterium aquaticum TaxID=1927124 RepID=A0A1X0BAS1_9MYCO|nr:oxidoreductase [Mycobacterium aquaticum]